jgi:hypothetical protein
LAYNGNQHIDSHIKEVEPTTQKDFAPHLDRNIGSDSNYVATAERTLKLKNTVKIMCDTLSSHFKWMQHLRWGKKHVRRVNGVRKTFKDPINPQVKPSSFPSLQETGKWYTILHSVVKFLGDRIKVGQMHNGRYPYRIPAFVTGFVEYFLSKSYRLVFGVDTNGFSISLKCYRWKGLSQTFTYNPLFCW